eukprot:6191459-Pleurochrysis_carterae.AAC.2
MPVSRALHQLTGVLADEVANIVDGVLNLDLLARVNDDHLVHSRRGRSRHHWRRGIWHAHAAAN